jgi:hypothetical protein
MQNTHQTPTRFKDRRSSAAPVQEDRHDTIKSLSNKWASLTPEQQATVRKIRYTSRTEVGIIIACGSIAAIFFALVAIFGK